MIVAKADIMKLRDYKTITEMLEYSTGKLYETLCKSFQWCICQSVILDGSDEDMLLPLHIFL